MGSSSLVVLMQLAFLASCIGAGVAWYPYLKRNRKALIEEPVGLLVVALVLISVAYAVATLLYMADRLNAHTEVYPGTLRDGAWAVLIALLRLAWPLGMLLAIVARWRLDNFDEGVIATRLATIGAATVVASGIFLTVVW